MKAAIADAAALDGRRMAIPVSASGASTSDGSAPVVATLSESDPADLWVACTPNDDTVFDPPPVALFVGVAGNMVLTGADGNACTFKNVPAGSLWPLQPTRVKATNTTCTDIILIYRSAP